MYDYNQLYLLMEKTVHKYNQFEKKKHKYQNGMELTHVEIHTIACIGDHPGLNLTTLASIRGITKSAASQMIYRLRDKDLVKKEVSSNSDAEICIFLTERGKEVYDAHNTYHANANSQFLDMLKQIPEDTAETMENLLQQFDTSIDKWMK